MNHPTACPNCGAEAPGDFCPSCGQGQGDLFPSLWQWLKGSLDELFLVDRKLFRTLEKLAWPPGELTIEWKKGRRASYVAPLRLYLGAALLFFVAAPTTGVHDAITGMTRGFLEESHEVETGGVSGTSNVDGDTRVRLGSQILSETLPAALLVVLVPVFAALLQLMNRLRGSYVEHLVTALNYHSFAFLIWVLISPLNLVFPEVYWPPGTLLPVGLNAVVLVATIARVQDVGVIRAFVRALFTSAAYFIVMGAIVGATLGIVLG